MTKIKFENSLTQNALLETANKTNTGLVIDRNTEIENLKKSLQQARTERDQAKADREEALTKQETYQKIAVQARAKAAEDLASELSTFVNSATEYRNRLQAQIKAGAAEEVIGDSRPLVQAGSRNGNGNGQPTPTIPAAAPKQNYLK